MAFIKTNRNEQIWILNHQTLVLSMSIKARGRQTSSLNRTLMREGSKEEHKDCFSFSKVQGTITQKLVTKPQLAVYYIRPPLPPSLEDQPVTRPAAAPATPLVEATLPLNNLSFQHSHIAQSTASMQTPLLLLPLLLQIESQKDIFKVVSVDRIVCRFHIVWTKRHSKKNMCTVFLATQA